MRTLKKNRLVPITPPAVARNGNHAPLEELPPHDQEIERAALACVLLAGDSGSQAEVESLLHQLKTSFFYMVHHRELFRHLVQMRMSGHAVELVNVISYLKAQKSLDECGGDLYVEDMMEASPSHWNFGYYLPTLKALALRRWCLAKTSRLTDLAKATELTPEQLREEFSEIYEQSTQIGMGSEPMIQVISFAEARKFEPDPDDFMVGDNLVSRGMIVTIGGDAGIGKSRLAVTLAVAGARGTATWQNYPLRSKWRTMILQSENDETRLKEESSAVPPELDEYIKVSKRLTHGLAFDNPQFRRELRALYDAWPFEMLVVDPWNDVSSEEGQKDYKQALLNIWGAFSNLPKRPALVIVAHLRKKGRDEGWKRKTGRELLHDLSGSLALGSSSRTVFVMQPVDPSMDDPRIVFEVAKANNVDPAWLKQHGTRSCWIRANAAFESVRDFDWEAFDNPSDPERRRVSEDDLLAVFEGEKEMRPATVAKKLHALCSVGESTAFRAISKGGYLEKLLFRTQTGKLKLKE